MENLLGHGPPILGADDDALLALAPPVEPARGERDHLLVVVEEGACAAGGAAAVLVVGEAIERVRGAGAPARDVSRARERGVALPVLATLRVVMGVAGAGLAEDGAVGLAGLEKRAVGGGGRS